MVLGVVLGTVAEKRRVWRDWSRAGYRVGEGSVVLVHTTAYGTGGRALKFSGSGTGLGTSAAAPQPIFYTVILTSLLPHALLRLNLKLVDAKIGLGLLTYRLHVS